MCAHYTPTRNDAWVRRQFGVGLPNEPHPLEAFPGYAAPIVLPTLDCRLARFGLIPHWAKDAKAATQIGRRTYNARSETVAEKPSYRDAWRKRQFAIALLDDFFEPNWETGRAVPWRIRRADGEPMGVASLWERWTDRASGEIVTSFTMLTVNADGHPVMGRMHKPEDEKRSVVVLEPGAFAQWLSGGAEAASLIQCPARELLAAEPGLRDGSDHAAGHTPSLF
ncbi:SOS response-associated peptidase [Tepidimonas taiwanensis]|uniref:SOS response-associated peptidase n=1 Tax=Tepidimonas taiwanensis TaxID=307486 RepID=UPI0009DD0211|nr:SOS response-associated peptidase [Tepidimonas taiwanensis]